MFERRVRIVLALLIVAVVGLVARAAQVQVAQAQQWRDVALETMRRTELIETSRGRILDAKGRPLAHDVPCIGNAAVAYWFITDEPDEGRLYRDVARPIARERTPNYQQLSREEQHQAVLSCMPEARQRVEQMWETLAEVGGVSREEIEKARREVVERVTKRRRFVVLNRYRRARDEHRQQDIAAWWRKWLLGEADAPPEMEKFEEPIADELQAHVIVPNLTTEAYNRLRKLQPELPGLSLPSSTIRAYPYASVTGHVTGYLAAVNRDDLRADPEFGDELRAYLNRDQIGRAGLEQLFERTLRGRRGRIERDLESGREETTDEPVPGQDVQITIDAEVQREVRAAFENVPYTWPNESDGRGKEVTVSPAPGAAVAISVETGAIIALVSTGNLDPNTYEKDFELLRDDYINRPLVNRATSFATVPGSTVKPIIGLAAIAEGVLSPHDTIQCDGFLHDGAKIYQSVFRCWTESMFPGSMTGHSGSDPHPTDGLNPGFTPSPGHLTLADALQRSCNVFFETLALRLGEERINRWMKEFGLGQTLGIGIGEHCGTLLSDMPLSTRRDAGEHRAAVITSGIGQSAIQATPLQIANVMAILARGGVAIRPTLTAEETRKAMKERRDLHLDREGLEMVRRGMAAVVTTPGGTGHDTDIIFPLTVAAKTGSAQTHPLTVPMLDHEGKQEVNEKGQKLRRHVLHATRDDEGEVIWYRRVNPVTDGAKPRQSHAWFVGYAPADNPKVAFAVFVEFGGSGGASAGAVAGTLVESLVKNGYLEATRERLPVPGPRGVIHYKVD